MATSDHTLMSLLRQAEEDVTTAGSVVAMLAPGYPSSFDSTVIWLNGQLLALKEAAKDGDQMLALARVRKGATEIRATSESLLQSSKAISQRMKRIGDVR